MAAVVRFVNPGADSGGDGTTSALSSGDNTHAYQSSALWESNEQTDLVADGDTHTAKCAGTVEDTSRVSIVGWTAGSGNELSVEGDNTSGAFNTSAYRINFTATSSYLDIFAVFEVFTSVTDMQVVDTNSGNHEAAACYLSNTADLTFERCIGRAILSGTPNRRRGFDISGSGSNQLIHNCLSYGQNIGATSRGFQIGNSTNSGATYQNCTVFDCVQGVFTTSNQHSVLQNFCAQSNTTDTTNQSFSTTNCASEDSGANGFDAVTETDNQVGTVSFEDPTGDPPDFTPTSGDTVARDNGLDLSGEFTDDLAGNTRDANFDIGCLEFIAAVGGVLIPVGHGVSYSRIRT